MPMPSLSDKAASRIMDAVESIFREDDAAEADPSAAIAKAADAHNIPTGHVNLMVRAYNTGRAAWQREAGETTAEKAAEFPLADTAQALSLLCPDRPEKRAAPATEYGLPPSWYKAAKDPKPAAWTMAVKLGGDEDEADRFGRAMKAARSELAHAGDDRLAAAAAQAKLSGSLGRMELALNQPGAPSFLDVKVAAAALYGKAGEAAMDLFANVVPGELELVKLAAVRPYHRTSDHPDIYRALAGMVGAGRELAEETAKYAAALAAREKRATDLMTPWMGQLQPQAPMSAMPSLLDPGPTPGGSETGGTIDPMTAAGESAQPSLFDAIPGEPKLASVAKQVGLGVMIGQSRDMLGSMLDGIRDYNNPADRVQKMVGKLSDPDHEAALGDIHTRAAIGTMVSRDPVLRGYDPRELAGAFNEISAVAPNLAGHPLMARPLLRKYLAMGHLDSFEGGEAVKAEKGLRDLKPTAGKPPESKPKEGPRK